MERRVDSYLLHGIGRLAFALVWNLVVWPAAYFAYRADSPLVIKIVVGIFVLLAPLLLWGGIRSLLLGMRYRQSVVYLDRHPIQAGESLTGRCVWPKFPPDRQLRIELECIRRSGKYREVLWSDKHEVSSISLQHNETQAAQPFEFHTPPPFPATCRAGPNAEHRWLLSTHIGKEGTSEFLSTFPITVNRSER